MAGRNAECYISISRTNKEQIKQSYRLCNENMLLNKCETYFTEYKQAHDNYFYY